MEWYRTYFFLTLFLSLLPNSLQQGVVWVQSLGWLWGHLSLPPSFWCVCLCELSSGSFHGYSQKLRVGGSIEGYILLIGCSCISLITLSQRMGEERAKPLELIHYFSCYFHQYSSDGVFFSWWRVIEIKVELLSYEQVYLPHTLNSSLRKGLQFPCLSPSVLETLWDTELFGGVWSWWTRDCDHQGFSAPYKEHSGPF